MVTSISAADTNRVEATSTPSIVTVVDAVNPLPCTGPTVPPGTTPIPAGIFSTERVPRTVTEPLATDTLESGEVAETDPVRPEADASPGTEHTITGNPARCPLAMAMGLVA